MNLQVYVNTRDRFGRVTGRRLVSAELHTLNRRTVWVRIGDRIVKRKIRRDVDIPPLSSEQMRELAGHIAGSQTA